MNRNFKKILMTVVAVAIFATIFMVSSLAATTTQFPDLTIYLPLSEANGKSVVVTDYIKANIIEGTAYGDYYIWPQGNPNYGSASAPNPGWVMGTNTFNNVRMTRATGNVTTFNSTSAAVTVGQEFNYTINIYDHLSDPDGATINGAKVKVVIVEDAASVPGAMTIGIATSAASSKDIRAKIDNRIKNLSAASGYVVTDGSATYSGFDSPTVNLDPSMTVEVEASLSDALVFGTTSGTPFTGQSFSFVVTYYPNAGNTSVSYAAPVKVTLYDIDPDDTVATSFPDLTINVPVSAANAGTYNIYSQVFANIVGGTYWDSVNGGVLPCTHANRKTAYDDELLDELKVYANVSTDSASAGRVPIIRTAADAFILNSNSIESSGILYTISLPAYSKKTLVVGDSFYFEFVGYDNLSAGTGQFAAKVIINVVADSNYTEVLNGDYVTASVYKSAISIGESTALSSAKPQVDFSGLATHLGGAGATVTVDEASFTATEVVANVTDNVLLFTIADTNAAVGSEYNGTVNVTITPVSGDAIYGKVNTKIKVIDDPESLQYVREAVNAAATVRAGDSGQYLITASYASAYKGSYRAESKDTVMSFRGVLLSGAVSAGSSYQNAKTTKGGWGAGGTSIKFQADAAATAGADDTVQLAFTGTAVADAYGVATKNQYIIVPVNITVVSGPAVASYSPESRISSHGTSNASDMKQVSRVTVEDFGSVTVTEIGTIFIKKATLGAGAFDLTNANVSLCAANYLYTAGVLYNAADTYTFTNVIYDIPDTEAGEVILCRAYVKYTLGGTSYTSYGAINEYTVK